MQREMDRPRRYDWPVAFLTISHAELDTPIRIVADPEDFQKDGYTFTGFPFSINLLTDTDKVPEARITLPNVDKKIGTLVRGITGPVNLHLELVALSEFDLTVFPRTPLSSPVTVEYSAPHLYLTDVEGDAGQISGLIIGYNLSREAVPGYRCTQELTPGLWR